MVRQVIRVPYSEEQGPSKGAAYPPPRQAPRSPLGAPGLRLAPSLCRDAMRKVPSLMFDMDLDPDHSHLSLGDGCALEEAGVAAVRAHVAALLEPETEAEAMARLHLRLAREDAARRGHALTLAHLAEVLARLGYGVGLRSARGGGRCGACLRNLRHSFLVLALGGPGAAPDLIVDPAFREQFEIAAAPDRYQAVLAAVPEAVVVPPRRLEKLVELLCAEMSHAFADRGLSLPPWRGSQAMLSKWKPAKSGAVEDDEESAAAVGSKVRGVAARKAARATGVGAATATSTTTAVPSPRVVAPSTGALRGLVRAAAATAPVAGGECTECGSRLCTLHADEDGGSPLAAAVGPDDDELDLLWDSRAVHVDDDLSDLDLEDEDRLDAAGAPVVGRGRRADRGAAAAANLHDASSEELASPGVSSPEEAVVTSSSGSDSELEGMYAMDLSSASAPAAGPGSRPRGPRAATWISPGEVAMSLGRVALRSPASAGAFRG